MPTLPRDINDLLETALGKPISEFRVTLGEGNSKGAGFLSDLVFVTLTHPTGEEHHLVIKQALPTGGAASMRMVRSAFANEIHFYLTCWPALDGLRVRIGGGRPFRGVARCYGAEAASGRERLVLEDLKASGFSMVERSQPFDLPHAEAVFRAYAEFHALSMALRGRAPGAGFEEMVRPLDNVWLRLTEAAFFPRLVGWCCGTFLEGVDPELRGVVGERLQGYTADLEAVFGASSRYDGGCPVLLHGDCWTSNFMFKYDESKEISAVKLIDFQIARRGSPVHDLSYCFYSCVSTEVLEKLQHLLKVYHDTLSDVLKTYGCAVEEIYPMSELQEEWRKYSKFGMMLGLMIWRSKMTDAKDVADLNKLVDNDLTELHKKRQIDMEKYGQKVCEIMMNAYENDVL